MGEGEGDLCEGLGEQGECDEDRGETGRDRRDLQFLGLVVEHRECSRGGLQQIRSSSPFQDCHLDNLELFLQALTTRMHDALGARSRVIWYDAVTGNGRLDWQNEFNAENRSADETREGSRVQSMVRSHRRNLSQLHVDD